MFTVIQISTLCWPVIIIVIHPQSVEGHIRSKGNVMSQSSVKVNVAELQVEQSWTKMTM